MKNISLLIMITLFLFACATPEKYDKELNTYIGKPQSALTQKFGKPSAAKILSNDDKVVTYTKANNVYVPSEFYLYDPNYEPSEDVVYSPFMGSYNFAPYGQTFGYQVEDICQTSFLIQSGIITGWKWRGNDCVAY